MRFARSAGCRCSDQWTGVGSFGVVASVASAAARFRPEDCFEQPRRGRRALDAPRDTGNTKERAKTTLLVSYWLSTCRRTLVAASSRTLSSRHSTISQSRRNYCTVRVHIHIYICIYMYTNIYINIYRENIIDQAREHAVG